MTQSHPQLKILFLTQVLPYPLFGGAKIRAYYMLRYLAQKHRVTLVSFVRDDDKAEDIAHLRQFCEEVHPLPMKRSPLKNGLSLLESFLTRQPLIIIRDRLGEMEELLKKLVTENAFDVVHADQTSMAQYGIFARSAAPEDKKPRILLDQHNALYLVVQRQAQHERGKLKKLLWKREAILLAGYETKLLGSFDEILTVTPNDREVLLNLLDGKQAKERAGHITAVPICVDPTSQPPLPNEADKPTIIHLGTMFWPPNIEGVLWFATEILPLIIEQVPDVNFIIAGKNPPPEIRALETAESPIKGHIVVTGFVTDPEPMLASSRVFIVPLLAGGGMRVKILDAWQWGLPMVSTTIGAEGIQIEVEENILLADEPQEFACAVIRVLTDPGLAGHLRENGRSWVEAHYDWRIIYQEMDGVYGRLGCAAGAE